MSLRPDPNPPEKKAKTRRKAGILQRLVSYIPEDTPKWFVTLATVQDNFNRYIWMTIQNSLPAKHGATHLGGSDNIVSGRDPQPITVNSEASAGTPQLGVSAADHVHAVDLDFSQDPIPQTGVQGNPKPPFKTLKQQTDWLNAQAVREYAVRPIIANTYR